MVLVAFAAFFAAIEMSTISSLSDLRVAIYSDRGVWHSGLVSLETYLKSKGVNFSLINSTQIKSGSLKGFDVLIVPGGWSYDYWLSLGPQGNEIIKNFVKDGGVYIGVCAGAYYASKVIVWEASMYHYSLGIADVMAIGPKAGYPWPTMAHIYVVPTSFGLKIGLNNTKYEVTYYGGPEFSLLSKNITVLALYDDDKRPAIVMGHYGRGLVVLTGVHLELTNDGWKVLDTIMEYVASFVEGR